jgi:hypothetical protein
MSKFSIQLGTRAPAKQSLLLTKSNMHPVIPEGRDDVARFLPMSSPNRVFAQENHALVRSRSRQPHRIIRRVEAIYISPRRYETYDLRKVAASIQ